MIPRLLSDPLKPDSGVSPDLDGRRLRGRHRLLDRLHEVLGVPHQHLRCLDVFIGSYDKMVSAMIETRQGVVKRGKQKSCV